MSEHNDGGPAFPMPSGDEPQVDKTTHYNEGMSLRDWFAGIALQGILSNPETSPLPPAEEAYMHADAMLKERKRAQEQQ